MNLQAHLNHTLFNGYYPDQQAAYPHYEQTAYIEEPEFTFLPKQSTFFESHVDSFLDVTRQSTDHTDCEDMPPVAYHNYNYQDYYSNTPYLDAKAMNMSSAYGTNTGNHFTPYREIPAAMVFPDHTAQVSQVMGKVEEPIESIQKDDTTGSEGESEEMQEVVLNAQLQSLLKFQVWSEEKDELLLKLGVQYKCDWKKIAKRFNHKKITPHFLKIRYKELTYAPLQRRVKFSHREDLMIAKYFEKYGSNWAQMAQHFRDRTPIMLKNRYYSFIRKRELIDILSHEVKEIEKEQKDVDSLNDDDSERYMDLFNIPREGGARNTHIHINRANFDMESSVMGVITPTSQFSSQPNHSIFNFDKNLVTEMEEKRSQSEEEKKEVQILKERIRSLQTLYLQTKKELDMLKGKNL